MRKLTVMVLTALIGVQAQAYVEFAESGDVTPRGTFKVGLGPQIRMSDGSGVNVSAHFESGLRDDLSWRLTAGGGETKFYGGGSVKWIPIPDYENQPAIGARTDLTFGSVQDVTTTVFRLAPLISKGFQTDLVFFTPYAAIPIGLASGGGASNVFAQLAIGSDIKVDSWENLLFNVELGSNLSKSFSYLSLNMFYFIDAKDGIKVRPKKN